MKVITKVVDPKPTFIKMGVWFHIYYLEKAKHSQKVYLTTVKIKWEMWNVVEGMKNGIPATEPQKKCASFRVVSSLPARNLLSSQSLVSIAAKTVHKHTPASEQ